MDENSTGRMESALAAIFGTNRSTAVIQASTLYSEEASLWGDRICFGCFYQGYSLLFWRNKSDQLQASIELTGSAVTCQKAVQWALDGINKALGKTALNLKPSAQILEITPLGDTEPLLIGESSARQHILSQSNAQAATAAGGALVAAILGTTVIWDNQAAGLWAGALPSFGVLAGALALGFMSARMNKLVWSVEA